MKIFLVIAIAVTILFLLSIFQKSNRNSFNITGKQFEMKSEKRKPTPIKKIEKGVWLSDYIKSAKKEKRRNLK